MIAEKIAFLLLYYIQPSVALCQSTVIILPFWHCASYGNTVVLQTSPEFCSQLQAWCVGCT